jgi:hypothetical protein
MNLSRLSTLRDLSASARFALLVCALCFAACHSTLTEPAPTAGFTAPRSWVVRNSVNMPAVPYGDPGGGWHLDFPGSNGLLGYVVGACGCSLAGRLVVAYEVDASDDAEWSSPKDGGDGYGTVSLYLESGADGSRWWSGKTTLQPGQHSVTLDVPLQSRYWHNVAGESGPAFDAMLGNVVAVGVTFGGLYSDGHGVRMARGTAVFRLVEMGVNG